jgi:histidinol dehydrogenase
MKLRRLSTRESGFDAALEALVRYEAALDPAVQETVRGILADVRARGDAAVLEYTKKFDGRDAIEVIREFPLKGIPADQLQALQAAHERIRAFHEKQLQSSWDYVDAEGSRLGQRVTPLERVGLYVPGGKAAYPSSVLMNAVPAKVAGVRELVMVSPGPNPMVLAAAAIAGVDRVIAIGGAQAVGALAYGTASVPKVDKIVGPGNVYVAEAKRQVFGQVGIDMLAGPSEILVICDGAAPADWVAMDLFSQAEHDESAQAILLCPDAGFIDAVAASIERLLQEMPRRDIIRESLESRGALVLTRGLDEACDIANRIAPEHLELIVRNPEEIVSRITHVGALFVGRWSSEALGDYCAGPNHVLPTSGTARFSSPLGVYDFQKRSSLIEISEEGAASLGRISSVLADGEGLPAHARAARMRLEAQSEKQGQTTFSTKGEEKRGLSLNSGKSK